MGSEHRDPAEICGSEIDFMEHLRFSEPKQTYTILFKGWNKFHPHFKDIWGLQLT